MDYLNMAHHWELLGGGQYGPHEARLIYAERAGVLSRVVRTWSDLRALASDYEDEPVMFCVTVNPVVEAMRDGRAARDADIAAITTLFFDFDVDGNVEAVREVIVERLESFCSERDFEPWVIGNSGGGLHAYATIDPINPAAFPDLRLRLTAITREVRALMVDLPNVKVDSVQNISRVVKMMGTRKPNAHTDSFFLTDPVERITCDNLREYILNIDMTETRAVTKSANISTTEAVDIERERDFIEATIDGSQLLRQLKRNITTSNDRSGAEWALTRELWLRRLRNVEAVAAVRCGITGSKSHEKGFRWTIQDVERAFEHAEANPEESVASSSLDTEGDDTADWFFTLPGFVQRAEHGMEWLLEPYIAGGGTVVIWAGDPKSFKSIMIEEMCMRIAMAGPEYGGFYVAAEGAPFDWRTRAIHLARGLGCDINSLAHFRFLYKPRALDFSKPDSQGVIDLRAKILDHKPRWVVLDPLRFLMSGDENDSSVATRVLNTMSWMVEDLAPAERPTWIIIHHLRKRSSNKNDIVDDERPAAQLRGSTQFWAAADTIASIRRIGAAGGPREGGRSTVGVSRMHVEHRFADEIQQSVAVRFREEDMTVHFTNTNMEDFELNYTSDGRTDAIREREDAMAQSICRLLADALPRTVREIKSGVKGNSAAIGAIITNLREANDLIYDDEGETRYTLHPSLFGQEF